jgi:hypothetical protein
VGWFQESLQNILSNNNFIQCFKVSIGGGMGRFVSMIMVVKRGAATGVPGNEKAYQQEPLNLKDRSVLPGTEHERTLNSHLLWKFIQTSQTETCSDCKSQGTMIVQGH